MAKCSKKQETFNEFLRNNIFLRTGQTSALSKNLSTPLYN